MLDPTPSGPGRVFPGKAESAGVVGGDAFERGEAIALEGTTERQPLAGLLVGGLEPGEVDVARLGRRGRAPRQSEEREKTASKTRHVISRQVQGLVAADSAKRTRCSRIRYAWMARLSAGVSTSAKLAIPLGASLPPSTIESKPA